MAAPVIRQSAGNGVGATSLITIPQALGSAVLAGSRLMAYITWGASTGTVASVSDTINGSTGWIPVPNTIVSEAGGPTQSQWWTNPNSAAGPAPTITATYSVAQQFRAIIVQEITGSDPADTILASAKSIGTATTSMVSNSITTLVANCLVIGACSNDTNSVAPTAGAGYTLDKTTTNQVTATEWQAQSAAGAITAAFTFGTAAAGVIQIIALTPAPAAGGTTWSIGTRRAAAQKGPFDPRGFLLSPFRTYDYTPSTSSAQTFTYAGSGGLQSGGASTVQVLFAPKASGGLQSGGHAPLVFIAVPKAAGGLQSGGTAPSSLSKSFVASGGLRSSGAAPMTFTAVPRPTGGLHSAGSAPMSAQLVYRPAGGLNASGSAPKLFILNVKPSGGLNAGGAASTLFVPAGQVQQTRSTTIWIGMGIRV